MAKTSSIISEKTLPAGTKSDIGTAELALTSAAIPLDKKSNQSSQLEVPNSIQKIPYEEVHRKSQEKPVSYPPLDKSVGSATKSETDSHDLAKPPTV